MPLGLGERCLSQGQLYKRLAKCCLLLGVAQSFSWQLQPNEFDLGSEEPDSLGPEGQAGGTGVRRQQNSSGPSADCLGLDGWWPACRGLYLSGLCFRARAGTCSWEFNQGPQLKVSGVYVRRR